MKRKSVKIKVTSKLQEHFDITCSWKSIAVMSPSPAGRAELHHNMRRNARKPVSWIPDKVRLKPVSSATETS